MPVMPNPQFQLRPLFELDGGRQLLWFHHFLAWNNVSTQRSAFGLIQAAGTPESYNNGEGGWARFNAATERIRCLPATLVLRPTQSPRAIARCQFGATTAMVISSTAYADAVNQIANVAGATDVYVGLANQAGTLFFVSGDGVALQSTNLGAAPAQPDEWEIRSDDDGVSWQLYKNGGPTALASHSTRVPGLTTSLKFEAGSAGAGEFLLDWTMGEADFRRF